MGRGEVTPEIVTDNAPIPLLMTRPLRSSEVFVESLPDEWRHLLRPVYSPLIEPVPIGQEPSLKDYAGAIFSSANGVRFAPKGLKRPAYCVGRFTCDVAQEHGWAATFSGATAEDLVATLKANPPKSPLLHLSGVHARGDISERLSAAGIRTDRVEIYDQVLKPLTQEAKDLLNSCARVIIPLFSPRTATHLAQQEPSLANATLLALSDAVAGALPRDTGETVIVTTEPNAQAMRAALAKLVAAGRIG